MAGWLCVVVLASSNAAKGEQNTVTAHEEKTSSGPTDASNVVVWLKPLDHTGAQVVPAQQDRKRMQLVQRNKSFQPHLLIVPVGSVVDFPNRDPFFHNVFSLFDGKRFDLGLYEAGATNSVHFDRVGVSFLFCNIHPEMSAVVVALDTPYYGVSDRAGNVTIGNVPDGKYELQVWYERSASEDLQKLMRTVIISPTTRELGTMSIVENPSFSLAHKNKYGQDYTPPPAPGYSHP
jgi:plastocyanin